MTDRNGLTVVVQRMGNGKLWMFVRTKPDGSPPSFHDWYTMIWALCFCEVLKYGGDPTNPLDWARRVSLPAAFFADCFDFEATYDVLRVRYGLPR